MVSPWATIVQLIPTETIVATLAAPGVALVLLGCGLAASDTNPTPRLVVEDKEGDVPTTPRSLPITAWDDRPARPARPALPVVPSKTNPIETPLSGWWFEVARIPCDGGPEFTPDDPIHEFIVWQVGSFRVTWRPFETYVDFHGDYQLDLDDGRIRLSALAGCYVPPDVDKEGVFEMDGEELVLKNLWLGSSRRSKDPPACGHRFSHERPPRPLRLPPGMDSDQPEPRRRQ